MPFLINYWQYIVIAILAALVALFANLWQGEVKAFAEYKGAVVALGEAAKEEAKKVNELHAKTLKESRDEWNKSIPRIRETAIDNYMRRFPSGLCNNPNPMRLPGDASGTETSDGAFKERVVVGPNPAPSSGSTERDTFISECAKDAGKLKSLRGWVHGNQLTVEK